ncbi:MAG: hydantoinase B/oxoprolinase family protein [Anaerolineales bacterium]
MRTDPFTAEIIGEMLRASSEEMFVTLGRTAQSPIIYEVLDMACGLVSPQGELIAEAAGVPGFIGCLSFAAKEILEKFEAGAMRPGDVYATNDPYGGGGTHLSDVVLVAPIIYRDKLVGFAANKAHWTEVGGMAAGSWTTDSTEIYQEGLQLPAIKIIDAGSPVETIIDLIRANVRLPEMTLGDFYAGVAALRAGERGVLGVCDKYGVEALNEATASMLDRAERVAMDRLAEFPSGDYACEMWIDDDGLSDEPLLVRVQVTISADRFVADFTGSAPQAIGPINTTWTGLEVSCREVFKEATDPHFPNNDGYFRPLEVICPDGTIFTAQRPAPVSTYWETGAYAGDLIWKAIFPVASEMLPVGHHLSVCGTIVSGHDEERGQFVLVEPQAGGWGATVNRDGQSGMVPAGDGETYIMPVEVCETRFPLLVEQFGFNTTQPAGFGQYRGGFGLVREYRVLCEEADLTATFGRFKYPPWGAGGGGNGSPNAIEVIPSGATEPSMRRGKVARHRLYQGDVARLITGVGGGYGDPLKREPALVQEDVRDDYLSLADARHHYGVVIDGSRASVDQDETRALRKALRVERRKENER